MIGYETRGVSAANDPRKVDVRAADAGTRLSAMMVRRDDTTPNGDAGGRYHACDDRPPAPRTDRLRPARRRDAPAGAGGAPRGGTPAAACAGSRPCLAVRARGRGPDRRRDGGVRRPADAPHRRGAGGLPDWPSGLLDPGPAGVARHAHSAPGDRTAGRTGARAPVGGQAMARGRPRHRHRCDRAFAGERAPAGPCHSDRPQRRCARHRPHERRGERHRPCRIPPRQLVDAAAGRALPPDRQQSALHRRRRRPPEPGRPALRADDSAGVRHGRSGCHP